MPVRTAAQKLKLMLSRIPSRRKTGVGLVLPHPHLRAGRSGRNLLLGVERIASMITVLIVRVSGKLVTNRLMCVQIVLRIFLVAILTVLVPLVSGRVLCHICGTTGPHCF